MIAKYAGRCQKCDGKIDKGDECDYDSTTRRIEHRLCPGSEETPTEETARELADRLGFIEYRQDVPADGILLRMSTRDRSPAAGRN